MAVCHLFHIMLIFYIVRHTKNFVSYLVGEDDSEAILETLLTYTVSIVPLFSYCIFTYFGYVIRAI